MRQTFTFDQGGRYWYEIVFDDLWEKDVVDIRCYTRNNSEYCYEFFHIVNGAINWKNYPSSLLTNEVKQFAERVVKLRGFR